MTNEEPNTSDITFAYCITAAAMFCANKDCEDIDDLELHPADGADIHDFVKASRIGSFGRDRAYNTAIAAAEIAGDALFWNKQGGRPRQACFKGYRETYGDDVVREAADFVEKFWVAITVVATLLLALGKLESDHVRAAFLNTIDAHLYKPFSCLGMDEWPGAAAA
jgi:hypothetical protein